MENSSLELQSYSHDKLSVCYENSDYFVVKEFGNINRGIVCAEKQAAFQSISNSIFTLRSIPVLSSLQTNDRLVIKMPFINGISGKDILTSGSSFLPREISTLLSMYLSRSYSESKQQILERSMLLNKIDQIQASATADTKALIDKFLMSPICQANEIIYPCSFCHGDLTFSNMVVSGETVFFLDFIPSTFESLLSDIAKIEQDLIFGWSCRYDELIIRNDAKLFAFHCYPKLITRIKATYPNAYWIITVLNWLRITPYIKDSTTEDLVISSLKSLIDQ